MREVSVSRRAHRKVRREDVVRAPPLLHSNSSSPLLASPRFALFAPRSSLLALRSSYRINAMPETKPRTFKSHAPLDFIKLWTTDKSAVIYLARNPKDVAVSLWHHSRSKTSFGYDGPFSHFLDKIFLSGRAESGSWWGHVGTYFAAENWQAVVEGEEDNDDSTPRLFCLWYEAMLRTPAEAVQGISDFVGYKVSMVKAEEIAQECSFSTMKKSELANGVKGCNIEQDSGHEGDVNNVAGSQIRKGGVGGWKDYMTVRQNEVRQVELRNSNTAAGGTRSGASL